MKKIGILVAMDSEMSLVFNRMEQERMKPVNDNFVGLQVFKGAIDDNVVFLCKSGIGKVNAAIAALTIIKEYSPDIIINVGVGGSLDIALSASNIVIGSAVKYCDVWCGKPNNRGQVQGDPEWYPCLEIDLRTKGIQNIVRKYSDSRHFYRIVSAPIVSGDWFMETVADRMKALRACGRAKAVDMESGAIAQVCCRYGVSFVPIKAISDYVGEKKHSSSYEGFWSELAEKSFDVLMEIISVINGKD